VDVVLKLSNLREQDTTRIANCLASCIENLINSIVIYLEGDLGAGKTTLARGLIKWYGFNRVKSPTYTLVESYQNEKVSIHHFDCYRISDPEELEYIGVREYSNSENIQLIEWPNLGKGAIPKADIVVSISGSGDYRDMLFNSNSEKGLMLLRCLELQYL
jgi:tRNA threonylcarbamoyladenosine biosynthesis protein TsaE